MNKYHITIAVKEYQTYEIEAESEKEALEIWEDKGSSELDVISYNYGECDEDLSISDEGEVKE